MAFISGSQLMIVRQKVYSERQKTNDVNSKVIRHYIKVEVVNASTSFQSNVQKCYDLLKNAYLERKPKSRFKPHL